MGWKCCRAKVDFPAPDGPIRMTRQSSGMVIFKRGILSETRDERLYLIFFASRFCPP